MLHLILGGARSGKSSFAERTILSSLMPGQTPVYIATAEPLDSSMAQRIAYHQQLRQQHNWRLIECPLALEQTLGSLQATDKVLIDCLTLWLSNQLTQGLANTERAENHQMLSEYLRQAVDSLVQCLARHSSDITLVSNEIGLGVVPMGKETRLFIDHQGWLNQKLAQVADKVTLVSAGIPLTLKEHGVNRG